MSTIYVTEVQAGGGRFDALPLERLETEITTLAGQISAATCQLLLAIAVYDRKEGWGVWGCRSMSHWLTWKTALSASAAREHVRIGHALEELPLVRDLFARGKLSYSQVRAVTRVAVPATEAGLVELARAMTAGQLDRVLARYRKVRAVTTETAQERWARRSMHSYLDDDGMRVTVIRQPPEDGERMVRAVDQVVDHARRARRRASPAPEPGVDPELDRSVAALRADALSELIDRAATGTGSDSGTNGQGSDVLLVIHTEAEVLRDDEPDGMCHVEHGSAIAAETARRLSCDSDTIIATHEADGSIRLGRRSRRVPRVMRRALKMRDETCVFPGCDAITQTDAHHVRFWTRGGPTLLANLALLCKYHHHRVHEGGYTMRRSGSGSGGRLRWEFLRPDGTTIPPVCDLPPRCDGLPAACNDIEPEACTPNWDGSGADQAWIIEGLLQAEGLLDDEGSRPGTDGDRAYTAGGPSERVAHDGGRGGDGGVPSAGAVDPGMTCGWLPPDGEGAGEPTRNEWGGDRWAGAPTPGSDGAWPDPWPSPWTSAWASAWPQHRDDGSA
jgi:hypothetical protein